MEWEIIVPHNNTRWGTIGVFPKTTAVNFTIAGIEVVPGWVNKPWKFLITQGRSTRLLMDFRPSEDFYTISLPETGCAEYDIESKELEPISFSLEIENKGTLDILESELTFEYPEQLSLIEAWALDPLNLSAPGADCQQNFTSQYIGGGSREFGPYSMGTLKEIGFEEESIQIFEFKLQPASIMDFQLVFRIYSQNRPVITRQICINWDSPETDPITTTTTAPSTSSSQPSPSNQTPAPFDFNPIIGMMILGVLGTGGVILWTLIIVEIAYISRFLRRKL